MDLDPKKVLAKEYFGNGRAESTVGTADLSKSL
jgi:hypothetical protein